LARTTSTYVCQSCGAQTRQFFGRCASCGSWNSLVEQSATPTDTRRRRPVASSGEATAIPASPRRSEPIAAVGDRPLQRLGSGYGERTDARFHVVAYDFGVKRNILRMLASRGCKLTVVPAQTPAADVMKLKPDGVFLSNGPGDPEPCDYAVRAIREFLTAGLPLFGICLGHQLLALACGAKTLKMKFGHHGANHPVAGSGFEAGDDHQPEPRLCRGCGDAACQCTGNPCFAFRRQPAGLHPDRQAGVLASRGTPRRAPDRMTSITFSTAFVKSMEQRLART